MQDRIRAAVRLRVAGDPEAAYLVLAPLWREIEHGDAFDRLFFAHSFADVQPSADNELRWDLVALDALAEVTEERAVEQGVPGGIAGLRPSLHLNLAHSYGRVGNVEAARQHYRLGHTDLDALDHERYGESIRHAFADYATEHPDAT
jgi:hypothetical protein